MLPLTLILAAIASLLSYPETDLPLSSTVYDYLMRHRKKTLGDSLEDRIVLITIDDATHAMPQGSMAEIFSPGVYAEILEALTDAGVKAVAIHRPLPTSSGRLYSAKEELDWWNAFSKAKREGVAVIYGFRWLAGLPVLPSPRYIEIMGHETLGFMNLPRDRDFKVRESDIYWPNAYSSNYTSFSYIAAHSLRQDTPLPPNKKFYIDYRDSFLHFSFNYIYLQAMDGNMEFFKKYFVRSLVLIGDTSSLNLDVYPTPLSAYGEGDWIQSPAVEIQAYAINTLIKQRLMTTPRPLILFSFFVGLIFVIFLPLLVLGPNFSPWLYIYPVLMLFVYIAAVVAAFNRYILLPAVPGIFVIILAQLTYAIMRNLYRRRVTMAKTQALDLYLDPALTGRIIHNPELLKQQGEKRVCTVFFADLEGFTSLSENMKTEDMVELVNLCYDAMTTGIERYDGFIDKYVGDSIMAVWGAPLPQANHAVSACLSALAQKQLMDELNAELKALGRPSLNALMGLNTGQVIAGNIGGKKHMAYTVMGDVVNLASRLVSVNKLFRTTIIASEATANAAGSVIAMRQLDRVVVVGRRKSITIFEILGKKDEMDDNKMEMINFFERALRHYWQKDFAGALARFERALQAEPGDIPSQVFMARCRELLAFPPDSNWDGITVLGLK
ncbi:MAG: adenylate/guanylate cyclase domain-containing protein [Deltaproteobacteria bacterium]|nr:adenylate/guanylate cyclase domain-containing protein [Deltaproteobacteria bacterium]